MSIGRKHLFSVLLLICSLTIFSSPLLADDSRDSYHEYALVPADCVACHSPVGVVTEHHEILGYSCGTCHGNADLDVAATVDRGRDGANPQPVYCAFCHATEARDIHVHDDGSGHIEHDHAIIDPSCSSVACHSGADIKAIHIDEDENDLNIKLSCYTCHGETHYVGATLVYQQDPVVRTAVAQGMAGNDITCSDCHGSLTHAAAHDHALIDEIGCEACHAANVVDEHITNQGLDCAVCHESSDGVVVNAIAAGIGGTDVYCYTCHGATDHSGAHNHAVITATFCADCHNADINIEHIDDHGLECSTCHASIDPLVVNAISTGSGLTGTDVTCDACHGSTDHSNAHDHAIITTGNCIDCHSPDINVEHIDNHGWSCATCHDSVEGAVIAAIDLGRAGTDVTCDSCHGVTDHATAHNHAVITVGDCNICHSASVTVEHIDNQALTCLTCHDSVAPLVVAAIAAGSGESGIDVDCEACHTSPTDHTGAHDQTVITTGNCADCHNPDINIEHTNKGYDCYVCHISTDSLDVAAIADGIAGNPVNCDACHGVTDHTAAHDHVFITAGNCSDCHSPDINVEHITNQGLACNVCHVSTDALDVAAIADGIAGTNVNCDSCHGTTDHSAAHDHVFITTGDCNTCHSPDINVEHITNQGLACNVCHISTDSLDVAAIADGIAGTNVNCDSCHGATDHSAAHDHVFITVGDCNTCHSPDINVEHITNQGLACNVCHISTDLLDVAAIADGIAGTNVNCDSCHGVTDHTAAHDHAVITSGDCNTCHSPDVTVEHITNQGLACNVCHISTDPDVVNAIATGSGLSGTDVNCDACHGTTDHSAAHDHTVISAPFCADCHSADINTEHITNQGLACNVCHISTDPDIVNAIAAGIAGSDVSCDACHGSTDHSGAHDHAVITAGNCVDCHNADINIEHIDNHGLTCNTCHGSGVTAVVDAIADGIAGTDVTCDACHGATDHSTAHDHAVITIGNCGDCHNADINVEHIDNHALTCNTCHLSTDGDVVAAIATGISGADVNCDACHGVTDHSTAHDHAVVTAAFCTTCHSADINVEHIDNHALACITCHESTDPLVSAAIVLGMSGVDVNCDSCHGFVDHAGAHNHAIITPGDCVDCHSPDINIEHIDNHGLDCATCHASGDGAVIAAINLGIAGTDVDCEACHGPVNHANVHDHAVITPGICSDCHAANVVVEHIDNHGLTCTVCHNSSDPLVIAAIDTGSGTTGTDVDCNACHGVVDHSEAHDHAIMPSSDCQRCHSASVVVEHAAHGFSDCNICHGSSYPVIVNAIANGMAGNDVTCDVCHPAAAAWHATAHDQIYLKTRAAGTETVISSTDDPADGLYDNVAAYLPSLTCGGCHKGIAENHWGNFHSGLRIADLFDSAGNPLPRGEIDPARPWITGPGMVGNWCSAYNRQLPDLNATFANETEFLAEVDMGIFEFVKECGSCHVGDGPGVENPFGFNGFTSPALDDSVRATALDGGTVAFNAWDFYVDESGSVARGNWFADSGILDVDCLMCHLRDFDHLARNASIRKDGKFAAAAPIGAGIAVPDTAAPSELDYGTYQVSRDGTNQLYLNRNFSARIAALPEDDNCLGCHMPDMVMNENEATEGDLWQSRYYAAAAVPSLDPANPDPLLAANRKPALKRNEMLKRGASWRSDEVHKFMGCGGCHSRTGKTQATNPVSAPENYLHSPGKGFDPLKYPASDDGSVKLCEDCHIRYGDLDDDGNRDMLPFAPPEMQVYHAQAGLLAKVVPTARRIADGSGAEETFVGSHIDIIACVSCHIKKRYTAARSVDHTTGGTYYNLVGAASDQVAGAQVVDLAYSWKENVRDKVIDGQPNPDWRRQIFPFNYLTSSYWDNVGSADANGDGFTTGAVNDFTMVTGDPFFKRTIKEFFSYDYVNHFNDRVASGLSGFPALDQRSEWAAAGADGNVIFTTGSEIDAFQSFVNAANAGYTPRLNLESRPYLVAHNILPIRSGVGLSGGETFALGAPTRDHLGKVVSYGCSDCHGVGDGLFNGTVTMLGQARRVSDNAEIPLTVAWNGAGDVKTSALAWNREGTPFEIDFSAANQTRDPERREFLGYDTARQGMLNSIDPATYGFGVDPVADILSIGDAFAVGLPANEYDWTSTTALPMEIGLASTVNMVAVSTGTAGTFDYRWNVNDEPGTLVGPNVEKTFNHIGVWRVMLTVIDEEGRITQNVQKVNVIAPSAATQVSVNVTDGSPTVTLQLSNLPSHDQVKFYFGDGTRQYVSDSADAMNLDRDYRLRDTYRMLYDPDTGVRHDPLNDPTPGNEYEAWVYKTSIRLYLGAVWVDNETVNIAVVIPVL